MSNYTFEQRPLSELTTPYEDLIQWLCDEFRGDDQWVDATSKGITGAVVVCGDDITIWKDGPLTDKDKDDAVSEYEDHLEREAEFEDEFEESDPDMGDPAYYA